MPDVPSDHPDASDSPGSTRRHPDAPEPHREPHRDRGHAPDLIPEAQPTEQRWDDIRSIERIPHALLPKGPERTILLTLARQGYGVRAFTANSGTTSATTSGTPTSSADTNGVADQTWYVWLHPLAQARPTRSGCISLQEWKAHCLQLVVEMLAHRMSARVSPQQPQLPQSQQLPQPQPLQSQPEPEKED